MFAVTVTDFVHHSEHGTGIQRPFLLTTIFILQWPCFDKDLVWGLCLTNAFNLVRRFVGILLILLCIK